MRGKNTIIGRLCVFMGLLACTEQPAARGALVIDSQPTVPALTADTLSGLAMPVIESLPPVPDTVVFVADLSDVAALAATIMVPVQGVAVDQLRDNFTEARAGHSHEAVDIPAPRGTPVVAAVDGKLTRLHNSVPGGLMVYAADVSDRFVFMYGHLDRYADGLTEGMPLERGQIIGYVGTTGNAPPGTPHLHFAVARGTPSVAWWKGTAINPYVLFRPSSPSAAPSVAPVSEARRTIETRARSVIGALASHDMSALAGLVHPTRGVRFTPYTRVDPARDRTYARDQLRGLWESNAVVLWGERDGTGDPMRLTFAEYYKSFIYNYDFANAPRIAYDAAPLGQGNSINNIRGSYPGSIMVEYHTPGIDPRYGGMDWKSLWLVFEKRGAVWYLVGVVHGSWTI